MNLFQHIRHFLSAFFRRQKVYYINGPDYLPPPLAADEESRLITRFENGDISAKDTLIVHNLRLVVYGISSLR